jgi:cytochrome c oxidase subunit IV
MTGHTSNPRIYFVIFAALIGLTLLTVAVAQAELPGWHTPVGLAIAVAKATLVVLFFMHALHSERLTWAVILTSVFMLAIMLVGTLVDYWSRPWLVY